MGWLFGIGKVSKALIHFDKMGNSNNAVDNREFLTAFKNSPLSDDDRNLLENECKNPNNPTPALDFTIKDVKDINSPINSVLRFLADGIYPNFGTVEKTDLCEALGTPMQTPPVKYLRELTASQDQRK